MTETVARPDTGGRLMLCADAFLYTGALFMLSEGALGIVATLTGFDVVTMPEWMQAVGPLTMIGSLVAGALIAWRMHGHEIRGWSWLGMLIGTVIGGPIMIAAFFALFSLGRFIPNPVPSVEGPWGLVIVLALVVVAFLVMPIVDAVRDLSNGHRAHIRLDWIRLGAFAIVVLIVGATAVLGMQQGSELGEAGIFMIPVAAASAFAVLGADLLDAWRAKRASTAPPLANA